MEQIIVSKADYDAGNYPKDVPIMVSMDVGMSGKSNMNAGKAPTKIKLTITPA